MRVEAIENLHTLKACFGHLNVLDTYFADETAAHLSDHCVIVDTQYFDFTYIYSHVASLPKILVLVHD